MTTAHASGHSIRRLRICGFCHFLFFAAAIILAFSACYKDRFDDVELSYKGTLAFPVGTVGFTLGEALSNDTLLTIGNDNGISLVYRQGDFFSFTAAGLLEDLAEGIQEDFSNTTKIGPIDIEDIHGEFDLAFADLVDDFQNPAIKLLLQQGQGNQLVVPAFQENPLTDVAVPPFADYNWLQIENGKMKLTVKNDLFLDLQNLQFTVYDNNSSQAVGSFVFSALPKGASQTKTTDLQGNTVGKNFTVVIGSFDSPGTGGNSVLIDLNKKLRFTIDIEDVRIHAGQVMLKPGLLAQEDIQFQFNLPNDERIYRIALNKVKMTYSITSQLQTGFTLRLTFPYILLNNQPVVKEIQVPFTNGSGNPLNGELDFSNTVWLLDQHPDQPYNHSAVHYEVLLPQATNSPVAFSSNDKVTVQFSISGLEVQEARGYFGSRQEYFGDGQLDMGINFGLFSPSSSPLLFDDPKLRIEVVNSLGVPVKVNFNATANGAFGAQATLDPPALAINYPLLHEIGSTKTTLFTLSKSNSNIVGLLATYPTAIQYGGSADINPAADPQAVNFITKDGKFTASAEFDLPFRFRVQDLVFRDTGSAVKLGLDKGLTIEDIKSAELKINYTNAMPLKTAVRILALDANGSEGVVMDAAVIEAAKTDAQGKVKPGGETKGELFVTLTREQVKQMENASALIYEARFQTGNDGQAPASMYTDYGVDMQIGMTVSFDK